MKILCIRFSALGDVAMLAPVVREYALSHPTDEITVLSKPFCAPLFDNLAPNIHFLGRDPKNDYKGIIGLWRLFRELHTGSYNRTQGVSEGLRKFDLVCDMHDVLRTKFLRVLFQIFGYHVRIINKHRNLRKLITAPEGKKQLKQLPTSFENYREVLPQASSPIKNSPSQGLGGSIGIAPFAAHQGKVYRLDKMERVIELLVAQGKTIYLFGGGNKEKEIMQAWAKKFANNSSLITNNSSLITNNSSLITNNSSPVHLASETCNGLRDELQLMKTLSVMISMDSANMHLASLVGTRVVSIWGATHPYAGFLGWGQSLNDCIQVDLPCRPCSIYGNKPCLRQKINGESVEVMACMKMITPEMIVEKVLK